MRAVASLVDASFEPDEIDVLTLRQGQLERVALVHHRPVAAGALTGACLGVFGGIVVGLTFGQSIELGLPPWIAVLRWTLFGMMAGIVAGALGGLVWWRTKVDIRGRAAEAQSFIVGTTVPEGRAPEVELVLNTHSPTSVQHYPVNPGEVLYQHVERQVVPRM
jgi:hypothetical protein